MNIFLQRSAAQIRDVTRKMQGEAWGAERLSFRVSHYPGVDLAAWRGAEENQTSNAGEFFRQNGLGTVWVEKDYVNIAFAWEWLWALLEGTLAEAPLSRGWAEERETPDFSPLPYGRNRLRMELYALQSMEEVPGGHGAEPPPETEGLRSLLWSLLSLGLWPEEQRSRLGDELAVKVVHSLNASRGHDPAFLPLWQGAALALGAGGERNSNF